MVATMQHDKATSFVKVLDVLGFIDLYAYGYNGMVALNASISKFGIEFLSSS